MVTEVADVAPVPPAAVVPTEIPVDPVVVDASGPLSDALAYNDATLTVFLVSMVCVCAITSVYVWVWLGPVWVWVRSSRLVRAVPTVPPLVPERGIPTITLPRPAVYSVHPEGQEVSKAVIIPDVIPVAALVWVVASGNLKPPVVDSTVPATVNLLVTLVVPMPTFPVVSWRVSPVVQASKPDLYWSWRGPKAERRVLVLPSAMFPDTVASPAVTRELPVAAGSRKYALLALSIN